MTFEFLSRAAMNLFRPACVARRRRRSGLDCPSEVLEARQLLTIAIDSTYVELTDEADLDFRQDEMSDSDELLYSTTGIIAFSAPPSGGLVQVCTQSDSLKLDWSDMPDAAMYDVRIEYAGDGPAEPVEQRVLESQWTLPADLASGIWLVRLRSVGAMGVEGSWQQAGYFTVGNKPQMLPVGETMGDVTFQWAASHDVESYELWLTNRDAKTRLLYSTDLTDRTLAYSIPSGPGLYAVWVRGVYADGSKTDWSDVQEFRVVSAPIALTSGGGVWKTARPTVQWNAVPKSTSYQVQIEDEATQQIVYSVSGLGTVQHQVAQDLPAGKYRVYVTAFVGTRAATARGTGTEIWLKLPPKGLSYGNNLLSWNAVATALTYTVEVRNSKGALAMSRTTTDATSLSTALPPGQYSARVFANFYGGSSNWSEVVSFELFRPPVSITSSAAPTMDATPTITWTKGDGASSYEVTVTREISGTPTAIYSKSGITSTSHRIASMLPNGINIITVRALFPDGSRSTPSAPQTLNIGEAVLVTRTGGQLKWAGANGATHYEVWINRISPNPQPKVVHVPVNVTTAYTLPALAKGTYKAWVRAVRSESGETYSGFWGLVEFDIT